MMNYSLSKRSELQQRLVAGLGGIVVLISAIIYNEWTYFVVFFSICLFCLQEFYRIISLGNNFVLKVYAIVNGLLLFSFSFLIEKEILPANYYLLIFASLSAIYLIRLHIQKDHKPFLRIGFSFLGIIYIAIPFSLLNIMVFQNGIYKGELLLGFLFILWANDTGAFFAGKHLGRNKLFASVSPKKTWEGSIGGCILAFATATCLAYCWDSVLPIWKWFAIAFIIVIGGTYGDLVESLLKRSKQIKDSGDSIPGHGGFLDRFDGLLIASPLITAFIELF